VFAITGQTDIARLEPHQRTAPRFGAGAGQRQASQFRDNRVADRIELAIGQLLQARW
jgi:hypothetical protein